MHTRAVNLLYIILLHFYTGIVEVIYVYNNLITIKNSALVDMYSNFKLCKIYTKCITNRVVN